MPAPPPPDRRPYGRHVRPAREHARSRARRGASAERRQRALSPLVVNALGLPAQASNAFVVGFLRRDYGAAGLFAMQRAGQLTGNQTVVALTVMTLFIPCVANFLVIWRERGYRAAATSSSRADGFSTCCAAGSAAAPRRA